MSEGPFDQALKHHREGRLAEAEQLYRQVLANDPTHAPALHYLGLIVQATGRLSEACELLQQAARHNPADAICHNNLANVLRELERLPRAVEAYKAAVRCDPNYINAHFNLASLLMDADDPEGAAHSYRQVLRLAPGDTDAIAALGIALSALGSTAEATACFRRVIALRPDDPVAYYNLATTLKDQGEQDSALELYRRALELNPDYSEAHNNVGLLLMENGELDEAVHAFGEAIRSNPQHIHAHLHLGGLLLERGDHAAAEEVSWRAVRIDPRNARALQSLGAVLTGINKPDEGEQTLRAALDIDPELAETRIALGEALSKQGRYGDAIMQLLAVQSYSPCYLFAQNNLAINLMNQGQISAAFAVYARVMDTDPGYLEAHSNMVFYSNYMVDMTPSDVFEHHRKWAQQHEANLAAAPPEIDLTASRRLHVGYISPDFRNHSVANFIEPMIGGLDRDRFTVTCYSDAPLDDKYTDRIRASADRWRDLRGLGHEKVAALIRDDGIDILVDLAGHTARNRMPVFARRAAPIQLSYLGYPNTTGLEQMDYRLTDRIADPPGEADELHSEELVRLPGGFLCYAPLFDAPAVAEVPALSQGHVTFGSFNNTNKVNDTVVAAWARILAGLPESRLLLKSQQFRDAGARRYSHGLFADHGIDERRVELMGRVPDRTDHLNIYSRVDVALDPFPYNGTTTTCEALWMGVPVVVLSGRFHRARVGASILHHAGCEEFLTSSIDAYVEKALELARDPQALTSLRQGLRERVANSALTDITGTLDAVQSAFVDMWRRYRESASATLPGSGDDDDVVRLNVGGTSAMPGWKIFNAIPGPEVDYVGNCVDMSQFDDNSIDELYASHIVEHLGYREELPKALGHFHRVLKPGSRLRISVPDLATLCRLYLNPELDAASRRNIMRIIYGGQDDQYDFHKVGFSWNSLRNLLQRVGFRNIARVQEFGIFNDTSSMRIGNQLISLNVEARK